MSRAHAVPPPPPARRSGPPPIPHAGIPPRPKRPSGIRRRPEPADGATEETSLPPRLRVVSTPPPPPPRRSPSASPPPLPIARSVPPPLPTAKTPRSAPPARLPAKAAVAKLLSSPPPPPPPLQIDENAPTAAYVAFAEPPPATAPASPAPRVSPRVARPHPWAALAERAVDAGLASAGVALDHLGAHREARGLVALTAIATARSMIAPFGALALGLALVVASGGAPLPKHSPKLVAPAIAAPAPVVVASAPVAPAEVQVEESAARTPGEAPREIEDPASGEPTAAPAARTEVRRATSSAARRRAARARRARARRGRASGARLPVRMR